MMAEKFLQQNCIWDSRMEGYLSSFTSTFFFRHPPSTEGVDLEKPKVIWFQLHTVKIEFVARN